jgi:uncharacterized protein YutD
MDKEKEKEKRRGEMSQYIGLHSYCNLSCITCGLHTLLSKKGKREEERERERKRWRREKKRRKKRK